MTDPITSAATWKPAGPETFEATLSERWANGPGAYGGIVAASVLRQMERVLDDDEQVPRTLNLHLSAPLRFEPAKLTVELDHAGMTVSHLSAHLDQSGGTAATASATFARARTESPDVLRLQRPDVPPPEEIEIISDTPMLPRFACEFFEYQYCLGAFPMSGADEPVSGGWLSSEEPVEDGPILAACLLDAWPPSIFSTFETFRRTLTVDLRYQFWQAGERSGATDEPFVFRAKSDVVREGYAEEDAVLWSRDDEIVARAKQLYAILD